MTATELPGVPVAWKVGGVHATQRDRRSDRSSWSAVHRLEGGRVACGFTTPARNRMRFGADHPDDLERCRKCWGKK